MRAAFLFCGLPFGPRALQVFGLHSLPVVYRLGWGSMIIGTGEWRMM